MDVTYKIIGGDGREYGPITLEELKAWIRDGRVARVTQVWRSDSSNWSPASAYAEIQIELSAVPVVSAEVLEGGMEPVGFWMRLCAYIVDRIIMTAVFYVVWEVLAKAMNWTEPDLTKLKPDELMAILPSLIPFILWRMGVGMGLHFIYDVTLNAKFGATLGKMIISARIVRRDGSPLGFKYALLRWLASRLSDMTCYIGYLFIAFREDKRALHDLIVGTQVIYKK